MNANLVIDAATQATERLERLGLINLHFSLHTSTARDARRADIRDCIASFFEPLFQQQAELLAAALAGQAHKSDRF